MKYSKYFKQEDLKLFGKIESKKVSQQLMAIVIPITDISAAIQIISL